MSEELKKCPECGDMKPADEVYERLDPYAHELSGDDTLYEMCDECERQKAMDI